MVPMLVPVRVSWSWKPSLCAKAWHSKVRAVLCFLFSISYPFFCFKPQTQCLRDKRSPVECTWLHWSTSSVAGIWERHLAIAPGASVKPSILILAGWYKAKISEQALLLQSYRPSGLSFPFFNHALHDWSLIQWSVQWYQATYQESQSFAEKKIYTMSIQPSHCALQVTCWKAAWG